MMDSELYIQRDSQATGLRIDDSSQCLHGKTVRKLLALFTDHYGLNQGSDLT
jgi:hypothetical protein